MIFLCCLEEVAVLELEIPYTASSGVGLVVPSVGLRTWPQLGGTRDKTPASPPNPQALERSRSGDPMGSRSDAKSSRGEEHLVGGIGQIGGRGKRCR